MKLVYYSSVLNHHQKRLCDEFYKYYGDGFKFVTTMEMEQQRLDLGYKPETAPYLFEAFRSESSRKEAFQMAIECDVLLAAVFPIEILHERMRRNKLTFRHIETYFKSGKYKILSPNALNIAYSQHTKYRSKPLYLLCASSHVSEDVNLFGAYPGKKYRWGYFPEMEEGTTICRESNKEQINLLWVGRFIEWKNPDYAIKAVADLCNQDYYVSLKMIGTGPMEMVLKEYAQKLGVEKKVSFCGSMSPADVRIHMRKSDIFLFTSTREEGWGAVLNEAMGNGCAVVASTEAGSTNYLVRNNFDGLVYCHNSYSEMLNKVKLLCDSPKLIYNLKKGAQSRISDLWNYKIAAKRFIEVSEAILANGKCEYHDGGPMTLVE